MALTETEQLQRSEVTIYLEDTGKTNHAGKPIYRLATHVRVQPVDSAGGPASAVYEQPMSWPFPLLAPGAMPPAILIEWSRSNSEFHDYSSARVG